jgi:hypothetical protein
MQDSKKFFSWALIFSLQLFLDSCFYLFSFFISKISLKNAERRNPITQEVYKRSPYTEEIKEQVKSQRTTYYPGYAPTPKDITYKTHFYKEPQPKPPHPQKA